MADERAEILAFVHIQNRARPTVAKSGRQAWSQACQALFGFSRFQILD
jgi:hypothetical protein